MNVVLYFSLAFFVSELILMISKRSKSSGTKTRDDRLSLILFWVAIPVGLTLGFRNANYQTWDTINYIVGVIGLTLFLAGLLLRWMSILQLKSEFTVDVSISNSHQLKTDGLYTVVRHPSYSGLLLICIGLAIAMNSVVSLLVITVPIFFAILYRIKVEENILTREFGGHYATYMKNTYRLIPKVY